VKSNTNSTSYFSSTDPKDEATKPIPFNIQTAPFKETLLKNRQVTKGQAISSGMTLAEIQQNITPSQRFRTTGRESLPIYNYFYS
jgi:hypothetical protein